MLKELQKFSDDNREIERDINHIQLSADSLDSEIVQMREEMEKLQAENTEIDQINREYAN